MIKYAKAVCTDSGHGVCFSIVFRKDFFVFARREFSTKQDYRITDWCSRLGIENRIVMKNSDIDTMMPISYESVGKIFLKNGNIPLNF